MLEKVRLQNFTAFDNYEMTFSRGINVFIGENGTGKTHLMKVLYSAVDIMTKGTFPEKLNRVFLPSGANIGRLVKRSSSSSTCKIEVSRCLDNGTQRTLKASFSNHSLGVTAKVEGMTHWKDAPSSCVYIPVKDMLANAPGFNSLYEMREIHFEEIYVDIIRRAYIPPLKGAATKDRRTIENLLSKAMDGRVSVKGEEFFLKNAQGDLEFTLLAEGFRKLGLLWLLLQNGTLLQGSVLFWDEPEANLNPRLIRTVISVLLELQKMGVQIFLATHNYSVLKELDLQSGPQDSVLYHSLFRTKAQERNEDSGAIAVNSTAVFSDVSPNAIDETYEQMLGRDMQKELDALTAQDK